MVAVHWEGCGDGDGAGVLEAVSLIDAVGYHAGELGFAGAWDAADGDHEAGVGGGGEEFC